MNADRIPNHLRQITPQAFALLGAPTLAYVRSVGTPGKAGADETAVDGWGIFAANGQQIGLTETRDLAFAVARQHDLEPVDAN